MRLIQPEERDAAKIRDSRFRDYQKLSTGWISARVDFYTDGKNTFNEDYKKGVQALVNAGLVGNSADDFARFLLHNNDLKKVSN